LLSPPNVTTLLHSIKRILAEKISALMTEDYLEQRAQHGSRAKFEEIMSRVPDVDPEEYDRF